MSSRVVFEVTESNNRFAGAAATLRELSLLFPMLLARPDQPAAQLFIAIQQMLQAASDERKAAGHAHPVLSGFLTARVKCFQGVVDDLLQAKRQHKLSEFLSDYRAYLSQKLTAAGAWRSRCDKSLPSDAADWLLSFDGYAPSHTDVSEIFTLGRDGCRFYLMQDIQAGARSIRTH